MSQAGNLSRFANRLYQLSRHGNYRKYHSSLSPLATRFNTIPSQPRTKNQPTGLFDIPELMGPNGFKDLTESVVHRSDALIDEVMSSKRQRKMCEVFDELSNELCKVADMAEYVRMAHPQESYRNAAEEACVAVSNIVERLNTHRKMYDQLDLVVKQGDKVSTTAIDDHVAKLFLHDFQQSGIHCGEADRFKFVELTNRILQYGQRFMTNTIHPRKYAKNAVPEQVRSSFPTIDNHIVVSGLYPDADNPLIRQAAFSMFLYSDEEQRELLTEVLKCRQELATLCGFPTYADRALKSGTVDTPSDVNEFLERASAGIRPIADADLDALRAMKCAQFGNQVDLCAWDVPYYVNKKKKAWLNSSTDSYMPYFSMGVCMDGLNQVFSSLYGVTFQYADMKPGETWHPDIYKLNVLHETEGQLGTIYCDFYDRPEKPNQDSHFTIRCGKMLPNGSYQNPIVVVMLSLPPPRWNGPTLLTPSMLDNLFHEFGHAMHTMLGRTQYQHVSGTRCSTDFAEVPSILMEYFTADARVLSKFAKHYQTGEPMPADQLQRMCASKHLFSAGETQQQLFYSVLDQRLHGRFDEWSSAKTTTDVLEEVQGQYYSVPYVKNTAWELRFTHLIGYGAKYYAYLVSRAIASSIWNSYFRADPFSREQGERFRRECLEFGGGLPSKTLVANFLQQEITPEYLSHNLIQEIEKNNASVINYSQQ